MSFDNVGGTTPVLDAQVLLYTSDYGPLPEQGGNLSAAIAALGQSTKGDDPILQSAINTMDFRGDTDPHHSEAIPGENPDDPGTPLNTFYLDDPTGDDIGGGYFEVSEPVIYVPEGFTVNDLYATEFILDTATGILTINLCFSTDPADFQVVQSSSLASPLDSMASTLDFGLNDPTSLQQQQQGSKCVVTVTRSTTTTSGSSSFTFLGGLFNYTSSSGTSGSTTTRTVTLEGTLRNGRCVLTSSR